MKNTNKKTKKNLLLTGEKKVIAGFIANILLPGTGIGTCLMLRGGAEMMSDLIVNEQDHEMAKYVYGTMCENNPQIAKNFARKYEGWDEFISDLDIPSNENED